MPVSLTEFRNAVKDLLEVQAEDDPITQYYEDRVDGCHAAKAP